MKIINGKEQEYAKYVEVNSNDPYSAEIVRYGEAWADAMEEQLTIGKDFPEFAKACSRAADVTGISGFMYGAAASAISHFWEHGEAFRRWYNKDTQIGDEGERANESGGVLNPALMTIEV